MRTIAAALTVAAALALAGEASAGSAGSARPAAASAKAVGKATTLSFRANAAGPPVNGRIPSSFGFSVPGFTFDSRAVKARCSHESALLNECPKASAIGAGTLVVHVVSTKFTRDTTVPINLYLQSAHSIIGVAFIGGPHVVTATLNTSHGIAITFDLPKTPQFPGVTLTLQTVGIHLGAHRVVVTHHRARIKHSHKFRKWTTRASYSLIHAPVHCTGGLVSTVTLGFADGTSVPLSSPAAC